MSRCAPCGCCAKSPSSRRRTPAGRRGSFNTTPSRRRTTSLHEHNERSKTAPLVARLLAGESIALVSDAGTPLVSDPGRQLVAAAHAAGIRVEPVPGPSAAMAVLSASGLAGDGFVFAGFPPNRSKDRKQWLQGWPKETEALDSI